MKTDTDLTDFRDSEARALLQRRLRFLMRLYIGCWMFFYFMVKRPGFVLNAYLQLVEMIAFEGLSKMLFVWIAATAITLLCGSVYWLLTRPPRDEPLNLDI